MVLLVENGASVLDFYTEAERKKSMETGYTLPQDVLEKRMEESMQDYLESEQHLAFVQKRLDKVLLDNPKFSVDAESMAETADTLNDVRDKLDDLRKENSALEQSYLDSDEYFAPEKARNVYLSELISFQYAYINALSAGKRTVELNLTLVDLPALLNDEYGNLVDITDVGRFFMEGVGKPIGAITAFGTSILKDVIGGVAEGLGIDKKLLVKIGIGAGIGIALIIAGLFAFQYSKSYITEKGKQKAGDQ